MEKEIELLYSLILPKKDKYGKDDVIKAIKAEGYDDAIANEVAEKLYGSKNEVSQTEKKIDNILNEPVQIKKEENIEKEQNFEEIEKLIIQMKSLYINTPNNISSNQTTYNNTEIDKLKQYIDEKEKELRKTSSNILIMPNNDIIDLDKIPRREWRKYRDDGKSLYDIRSKELREKRRLLNELKTQEEKEKPTIERKRERHTDTKSEEIIKSEKRIDRTEKRKRTEDNNDDVVSTIYEQVKRNPNIYDEPQKEETKKDDVDIVEKEITKEDIKEINEKETPLKKEETKKNDEISELETFDDFNMNLDSETNDEIMDLEELDKKK